MHCGRSIEMAITKSGKRKLELANEMDISVQTLNHFCRADFVTVKTLKRVADVLDMKVSELIALSED